MIPTTLCSAGAACKIEKLAISPVEQKHVGADSPFRITSKTMFTLGIYVGGVESLAHRTCSGSVKVGTAHASTILGCKRLERGVSSHAHQHRHCALRHRQQIVGIRAVRASAFGTNCIVVSYHRQTNPTSDKGGLHRWLAQGLSRDYRTKAVRVHADPTCADSSLPSA